jgi:alcohol dehydrogenase class IV
MLNASVVAGMAFTNVSLGIVHSMAHTLGSYFHVPHGVANAMLLPYVIQYNSRDEDAKVRYQLLADKCEVKSFYETVLKMNKNLKIPKTLKEYIKDDMTFDNKLDELAAMSLKDGCTKTNPVIPSFDQFKEILNAAYYGMEL